MLSKDEIQWRCHWKNIGRCHWVLEVKLRNDVIREDRCAFGGIMHPVAAVGGLEGFSLGIEVNDFHAAGGSAPRWLFWRGVLPKHYKTGRIFLFEKKAYADFLYRKRRPFAAFILPQSSSPVKKKEKASPLWQARKETVFTVPSLPEFPLWAWHQQKISPIRRL